MCLCMAINGNHTLTAIQNFMGDKIKFSLKNDPCTQDSLLRRGPKQRLRDYPGYEVDLTHGGIHLVSKRSITLVYYLPTCMNL